VKTQQKSENGVVAKGRGNTFSTENQTPEANEQIAPDSKGAKAILVTGEMETESKRRARAEGIAPGGVSPFRKQLRRAGQHAWEARSKALDIPSATMEAVTEQLEEAFLAVYRNKGAGGPDGKSVDDVRAHWPRILPALAQELLSGRYQPGNIRRVWIEKSNGGQRGLGIPNVIDRVVQESIRRVLEPHWEPKFHDSSHGFRPGRSCHTAIAEAITYIENGCEWVVDLDIEKFFDTVHHARLMAKIGQKVQDERLLKVLNKLLIAKIVLPDGIIVKNEKGVPQGGPLSPLLSNIVLDELDWELNKRGHCFVRYADDCNIYVRTERAGERVMASTVTFIEKKLRLKVNASKSAVSKPERRHFLGFSLKREENGKVSVNLSQRSQERIAKKIVELTPRNWGKSIEECLKRIGAYLVGWTHYFGICTEESARILGALDAHIRRRLRAIQLKQWKCKRAIVKKLLQLGAKAKSAWKYIYEGRKSIWKMSHSPVVDSRLNNSYWLDRGLVSILKIWTERTEKRKATQGDNVAQRVKTKRKRCKSTQLRLTLEPERL
jgi:RNA-directed DNA polymerase